MAWVSPTGHNDPDSKWGTETYAYDDDTGSSAINAEASYDHYLELNIAAIPCDKVRIYAEDTTGVPSYDPDLDIDVYYGGEWHNIWSGVIARLEWIEKAIGSSQLVTKARIKSNTSNKALLLYEFDFNSLPLTVETDACSNPTQSSLQANGDLVSDGGVAVFRRGFQYFKGSSGDPLDLIKLLNPSFERGILGYVPYDWTHQGGTGSISEKSDEKVKLGNYALKVKGRDSDGAHWTYQVIEGMSGLEGEYVTFGAWLWCGTASRLRIGLRAYDDEGQLGVTFAWHTVANEWQWIDATRLMDVGITKIRVDVHFGSGTQVIGYADGAILVHDDEILAVYDDGSFSEGEYNDTIEGLDAESSYRVRAFVQNADGIAYGNVVTCATTALHRRSSFFKMF